MNTDTLREKFLRSEEALNRLGDDTKELVFSRVQELRASKDYLETLIKEKEAVDSQITEQEAKIASYQEEINTQSNLKAEMVDKRTSSSGELQDRKVKLETLQNEINEVKTHTIKYISILIFRYRPYKNNKILGVFRKFVGEI